MSLLPCCVPDIMEAESIIVDRQMKTNPNDKPINPLCQKCLRECKQPAANLLVECPRYFPLPFKVDKHKYDQMGLFDEED